MWSGYSGGMAKRQVERHKSEGGSAKFHDLIQMAAQSSRGEQVGLKGDDKELFHSFIDSIVFKKMKYY